MPNNYHLKRTGWDAPSGMCCISRTLRAGSSCCNNSEQTCSSNPPSAQFCAQFSLSATPPGQTRKAACPGLSSVAAWLNWEGSVCLKLVIQPWKEGCGTTTKVDCAPHCGWNYFFWPQGFEFGHSAVQVGVTNQAPVPSRLRPLSHYHPPETVNPGCLQNFARQFLLYKKGSTFETWGWHFLHSLPANHMHGISSLFVFAEWNGMAHQSLIFFNAVWGMWNNNKGCLRSTLWMQVRVLKTHTSANH